MTNQELNCRVAELCGAKWMRLHHDELNPSRQRSLVMPSGIEYVRSMGLADADGTEDICQIHALPNYCGDLNAMHEVWSTLTERQRFRFTDILVTIQSKLPDIDRFVVGATARQRAEAFVKAMEKL